MSRESMPSAELTEELLAVAVPAAKLAGEHASTASDGGLVVSTKSTVSDLVTQVDTETEQLIVAELLKHRPEDSIAGEEGTSVDGTSGIRWHIDPIDGTANFVYGQPGWSVSIAAEALQVDADNPSDAMIVGVVFDPRHDDLYQAARGQGAKLNNQSIGPRSSGSLDSLIIATGFGYDHSLRCHQARVLADLLPQIGNIRRFGSAAVDLCLVAAGRVDAYYESGLNLWDRAAGALIAAEAGAIVDDLQGGAPTDLMTFAASPTSHQSLSELLIALDATGVLTPPNQDAQRTDRE